MRGYIQPRVRLGLALHAGLKALNQSCHGFGEAKKLALCGYVELQAKLALGSLLSFEGLQGEAR